MDSRSWCASVVESHTSRSCNCDDRSRGGFVPFEIELACAMGAQRAHLGERILSVDTAVPSALAQGLMAA